MGKNHHRKTLFKGNRTAEEVHQRYAFPKGAKCPCGRQPLIRFITMAAFKDATQHYPELLSYTPDQIMKILVTLKGVDGKPMSCIRLGIAYSCKQCGPIAEREAAKLPSWMLVEIHRGPTPDKFVSGRAGGSNV